MNMIEIKRDLIFIRSSSFAVAQVFLIRLEKPVVQAGWAELRMILIPWAGSGKDRSPKGGLIAELATDEEKK